MAPNSAADQTAGKHVTSSLSTTGVNCQSDSLLAHVDDRSRVLTSRLGWSCTGPRGRLSYLLYLGFPTLGFRGDSQSWGWLTIRTMADTLIRHC
jgi:hypothetical protein